MAIYRIGERVCEWQDRDAGPGTVVDVLPGARPYRVEWDGGGWTRVAGEDLESFRDDSPAGGAAPCEGTTV